MSNENLSIFGSSPPRKDDELFGVAQDWQNNACIVHWHHAEWAYSNGYRLAARHLTGQVCESGREQDLLVYPIVYLYRHHAELILKSIIRGAFDLLYRELLEEDQKTLASHGLAQLWKIARPLVVEVCASTNSEHFPPDDLEGIDSYIAQIHDHDPDGQRFRYPTTKSRPRKKGSAATSEPSLRPELTLINIRKLSEAMEKLADYLEGIDDWFGNLREADSYDG